MKAVNRIEKHQGFTLTVMEEWITIIHDVTGYQVAGPVAEDADVRKLVAASIPFLRGLLDAKEVKS